MSYSGSAHIPGKPKCLKLAASRAQTASSFRHLFLNCAFLWLQALKDASPKAAKMVISNSSSAPM